MNTVVIYFIQVTIYSSILIIGYRLLFKKHSNFSFNRTYLLTVPFLALLLPFIELSIAKISLPNSTIYSVVLPEISIESSSEYSTTLSFSNWILLIYIAGIIFGFTKIAISIYRLYQIKKSCDYNGKYYLLINSTEAYSFLGDIYIGQQLSPSDQEIAFQHELVHQKKRHWVDLLIAQLFKMICWFTPFAYLLLPYLKEQHEYEADYISCANQEQYIALLLKQKFQISDLPIGHHFNSSIHLKTRIMRIQERTKQSISIKSIGAAALIIGITFIGIQSINATNPVEHEKETAVDVIRTDSIYDMADVMPVFNKDEMGLQKFIAENTVYPEEAKEQNISGRVFISFVVGLKGKVEDVKILKGAHPLLDQAALNVINKIPKFKSPGMHEGKTVRVRFNTPISFATS